MYEPLDRVISLLEKQGFEIRDAWDVVEAFESKVARYAGVSTA
jgi:hypothetical protein